MALIPCTECGKEISDKAVSCPNCGSPTFNKTSTSFNSESNAKVTRPGAKWEAVGTILVVVGMITAAAIQGGFGILLFIVGFVVFIIGRFK